MRSAPKLIYRMGFVGLTCVVLVGIQQLLPVKEFNLIPNTIYSHSIYSQHGIDDANASGWLDKSSNSWFCKNSPFSVNSCGFSLNLLSKNGGVNFSGYESLTVNLKHNGEAKNIRLYIRDLNLNGLDTSYTKNEPEISKFMYVLIPVVQLNAPLTVPLTEFEVADWWLSLFEPAPEGALPSFENITNLGIDFVESGNNEITINSIKVTGSYFNLQQCAIVILVLWLFYIGGEAIYFMRRRLRKTTHNQSTGENEAPQTLKQLKASKVFNHQRYTDLGSGLINRDGLELYIEHLYTTNEVNKAGFLLIGLDNYSELSVNDSNLALTLQKINEILLENTGASDLIGRWDEDKLLVIFTQVSQSKLILITEKIRMNTEKQDFAPASVKSTSISIGVTYTNKKDPFSETIKRLEQALQKAVGLGGNRYEYTDKYTAL